eukprot:6546362-Prymnesium_polylepis.1
MGCGGLCRGVCACGRGVPGYPTKLREAELDVIGNDQCKTYYGSSAITGGMVCARIEDRDSCSGDSGGPLFVTQGDGSLLQVRSFCVDARGCGIVLCARAPHTRGIVPQR